MSPEHAEQLLIALEPEAASIYCRKLRLHQVIDLSLRPITNGFDPDGSRPFDSSFRQGSNERQRVRVCVCVCVCVFLSFIISINLQAQHCVPGIPFSYFSLRICGYVKDVYGHARVCVVGVFVSLCVPVCVPLLVHLRVEICTQIALVAFLQMTLPHLVYVCVCLCV